MTAARLPLLSVVIPTAARPQYLPRAVTSAFAAGASESVEVIVVPNGPDRSWRESLAPHADRPGLRVEPVARAHGNAARNHGLALARGRYVRFLDDDDYLLPAAAAQLEVLESTGAEICSGAVRSVDADDRDLGLLSPPGSSDFVCAVALQSGFRLPVGIVYRRASIASQRWNEAVDRAQDYVWLLDLAAAREWQWIHRPDAIVGVWFQHPNARIMTLRRLATEFPAAVTESLLGLEKTLRRTGRNMPARDAAIAAALWQLVHSRFPLAPRFWHRIAREAQRIAPRSRPQHPLFEHWPLTHIDPLMVEWCLYPLRQLAIRGRERWNDRYGWDYRHRL